MTADDRVERRLPELFDELAAARVPDYFDSLLQRTARTRQRPAWSSLERWLPMGVVARSAPLRLPSWRPIVLLLILVAIVLAASAALFAASRPHLPPPFGPARNGLVLLSANGGGIVSVDPVTGATTSVTSSAHLDWGPFVAPDGRQFIFNRTTAGVDQLWAASIDGSNTHQVLAATNRDDWIDWSPGSDRLVIVPAGGGTPSLVDVATGATAALKVPYVVSSAVWRPNSDQLVLAEVNDPNMVVHLVTVTGQELKSWPTVPGALPYTSISPDGRQLAYHSWSDGPGLQGRIHLLNLDTGADTPLTPDLGDKTVWENARFSPDGSKVMADRLPIEGTTEDLLSLLAVDGSGSYEDLGQSLHDGANGGVTGMFSPDGTRVLANYADDHTTWLYSASGGPGRKQTWAGTGGDLTWQRLAP